MRFLFVDRILQLTPGECVRGVKHITQDDTTLCQDEKGKLCFIPSLIGETLGQLAAWNVMFTNDFTLRPVAGVVSRARLHRPAYVGETLLLESFIEALDDKAVQYRSVASIDKEVVFSVEGALGPLLPMAEFIDEATVRRQFAEINRPGDWLSLPTSTSNAFTRDSNARLLPWMSFDSLIDSEPGVRLTAEKRITRAAPFFADHFPYKPVLPLTVLLECKMNLAREFLSQASFARQYQVSELRKIKMSEFVYPGDVLVCHLTLKKQDEEQLILSFRSEVLGKRVCVLDLIMVAKND
ncbi:MAG: hydroxymyristoyl-ACP dehydratase [Tatlockia sp.]|jgi:3-hydroxymyristoyl/3-hydroxydecanoyl-(acyl carrier protein) dehydratase